MIDRWIPPARQFAFLSWPQVAAAARRDDALLLQPVAAIEQHGPHLPLVVDTAIVMGVLGRALALVEPGAPVWVLPPLCYGKSNEHIRFPGTISLGATTLLDTLADVADSVHRAGFRKLAFVNGHGGQPEVVRIAARDARERHPDFTVFPSFVWSVPSIARSLVPEKENMLGIHAGALETALMLALMPEQVDMAAAVCEYPLGVPDTGSISMEGERPDTQGFAWMTHDLTNSGVLGDPMLASAEMGHRLLESLGQGWARQIVDMIGFRPPTAGAGPLGA